MKPQTKIRRMGYSLMSLASVALFLVGILSLFQIVIIAAPPGLNHDMRPFPLYWAFGIKAVGQDVITGEAWWRLVLGAVAWSAAYLWPLISLRRLGSALFRSEPLSHPVAQRFLWLAHAMVGSLILRIGVDMNAARAAELLRLDHWSHVSTVSLSSLYSQGLTCVCLYIVAHLMALAVDAAEDSRSIV